MTCVTYCLTSPDSTIEYACTLGNRGPAASRSRRLFSWSCVSCKKSSREMIGRPLWFENWGKDLVELGFAHHGKHGEVIIPNDQLHRILNFDETCLSHDGSNGARGGCPEVFIYNPRLPFPGKRTSKCTSTTTMITGSTAAGEALPPHFQFQTSAKSDETQHIRIDVAGLYPKNWSRKT